VGRVVTCWLCLLYNDSCQVSGFLLVCGYLLLVARGVSVIVCWLMASWMNVVYAVCAFFFFFFFMKGWFVQLSRFSPDLVGGLLAICVLLDISQLV